MRCITARILAFAVALGLGFSVTARAVDAASPLVTIPVGQSVNYHITSHADMGIAAEQHDNYVAIYRASPTVFNVKVDGAPAGSMGIDTNGNLIVPAQLTKIMGPFQQMAAIMRSAPSTAGPDEFLGRGHAGSHSRCRRQCAACRQRYAIRPRRDDSSQWNRIVRDTATLTLVRRKRQRPIDDRARTCKDRQKCDEFGRHSGARPPADEAFRRCVDGHRRRSVTPKSELASYGFI